MKTKTLLILSLGVNILLSFALLFFYQKNSETVKLLQISESQLEIEQLEAELAIFVSSQHNWEAREMSVLAQLEKVGDSEELQMQLKNARDKIQIASAKVEETKSQLEEKLAALEKIK